MSKFLIFCVGIILSSCIVEANNSNIECIQESVSDQDQYDYRLCLFDLNAKKTCEKWKKKDPEIFDLCEFEVSIERSRLVERMDEAMVWRSIKPIKLKILESKEE